MFRRFDAVIDYPLPAGEVIRDVIRARLANVPTDRLTWSKVDAAAEGLSHGESPSPLIWRLRKRSWPATAGLPRRACVRRCRSGASTLRSPWPRTTDY